VWENQTAFLKGYMDYKWGCILPSVDENKALLWRSDIDGGSNPLFRVVGYSFLLIHLPV
jgi:hypothetical protein